MTAKSHLLPVYKRAPYKFIRGKGSYLFDDKGKKYLDLATGIAVNSLGYNHPKVIRALQKQAKKVWHVSNLYEIEGLEELAKELCLIAKLDYAFFTNSGAEGVECGIKMVRKYHYENGNPNKYRIIVFEDAFHGRTNATIAASNQDKMVKGYAPLFQGFDIVKRDVNSIKDAITADTGAILLEPIQGEGGINIFDTEFLKAIRAICDEYGLLLFLDEVQCGVGRTGKFFAHQWAGIQPDIISVAKGIGNGFPIGACLCNQKVGLAMTTGSHGSTYGNNPLGVAVATAIIKEINREKFYQEIIKKGEYFIEQLNLLKKQFPNQILEVKGRGLMIGIRVASDHIKLVENLRKAGLLTVPAQNSVIRILPPLNISFKEINLAIKIIAKNL